MEILVSILSLAAIYSAAYVLGKILAKIKLPSILGWLIAGMLLGPCLGNIVSEATIQSDAYQCFIKILEAFAGVMIGSEIVFKDLKQYGAKTLVITVFQSLGTFLVVTAAFLVVFALSGTPLFLAFIFGGIALATAPAPVLSIVKEYRADGPVTKTLIPLSVLDDIIAIAVFFTVISLVAGGSGVEGMETWKVVLSILFPILSGSLLGIASGFLGRFIKNDIAFFAVFCLLLLVPVAANFLFDFLLFERFLMNYILVGVFYSCFVVNFMPKERKATILKYFNPALSFSFLAVIVNLGMPLDVRSMASAGLFTAVYIVFRSLGKIGCAFLGGKVSKSDPKVTRFLGLTLLPHSGVSLLFTGISISVLGALNPTLVPIVQGTIASAAILNEIIAVILAKIGLEKAGEIRKDSNCA